MPLQSLIRSLVVYLSVLKKEFAVLVWKRLYFHKFHAGFDIIVEIIAACCCFQSLEECFLMVKFMYWTEPIELLLF